MNAVLIAALLLLIAWRSGARRKSSRGRRMLP
jgi:hypothetical protein